ncbi:MAG: formimidoylglutamate deiminase [Crocinitomicaceae bacterium]|nr:formimidoylglutamate deiminase [Crocinitomicaceae bacterium]|tara:strand:- start:3272 stop:4636 length:1365 start_codon:yes stop_codon:yes gene_type:complete
MKEFNFKGLLQKDGWIENARVTTDANGLIKSIEKVNSSQKTTDYAIAGFQNAHSHAFQYAMAGLAELHSTSPKNNDFWSWRTAMYNLALSISPDDMESIATMLYKEMLRNGYTHVAEFHYLHHDKSGKKYRNLAENGERLIAAAKNAGIKITLIPIFYQKGGFGKDPEPKQKRFISDTFDSYIKLYNSSKESTGFYSDSTVGIGIHSMRGVCSNDIIRVSNFRTNNTPFHIHVSEQLKEIEDCRKFLGQRPVEWLSNNIPLSEHYHLVHATHINEKEVSAIATTQTNVVLCPTTEGNLGDGIFPLKDFLAKNGNWSIGTDSHVSLNPMEEIRLLDYGQRLISHNRNTFGNKSSGDNGTIAINSSLINGKKAMGVDTKNHFEIGNSFDALIISDKHPLIAQTSLTNLSNTIVYSSDSSMYKGTIVNGNWLIENGKHCNEKIDVNYNLTLKKLSIR